MRVLLLWLLLFSACQAPRPPQLAVPVTVVGDGEDGVLLSATVVPCRSNVGACERAANAYEWRALRARFAFTSEESPSVVDLSTVDLFLEQVVVASLPEGAGLTGIVVSSEEGVDVVTLDVVNPHSSQAEGVAESGTCCFLRIARRPCQLAVILRDQEHGLERTLAVFPGL